MKNILIIICLIFSIQGYSQLGTTLSKPVPEKEFQEIKSILSAVKQSAFRLEMNVIGANGAIRKEVLGMKNLAGLQKDATGKNFMVNNGGAVGGLQQSRPGGTGTGNAQGNNFGIPDKNSTTQNQGSAVGTARVDQMGSNNQNRPGSFGGRSMGNPGGGLSQGKSGEGGDKPDKGGGEPPKNTNTGGGNTGGHNNTGGSGTSGGHNNTGGSGTSGGNNNTGGSGGNNNTGGSNSGGKNQNGANQNTGNTNTWTGSGNSNNGGSGDQGGKKPEDKSPVNTWTGSGTNTGGGTAGGDKKPEAKGPTNTWTGAGINTGSNTWTGGSGNSNTGGGRGEEKDKKPTNTYTPSGGLAGNPSLGGQPNPTQQQMGANRMISMPPDFQRGNFFICDICNTGSLGAANLNRLEAIMAKYK